MSTQLAQLGKIAYYEFRMHWRERALLVVILAIGVMNILMMMIVTTNTIPTQIRIDSAITAVLSAPISVALAMVLPIIVANTIPKDQQWGVRELLDTLPIAGGVYLAGKILGMWAGVLSGLAVLSIVTGVIYWQVVGAFDLGQYIEMWLVVGVMLVVLNGTLGVLLPAGQPNRRRAIIVMGIVFALPFFFGAYSFESNTLLSYLNPIRPAIIMYYVSVINTVDMKATAAAGQGLVMTLLVGLVELGIIWAAVWGWLRWKGSR